LGRHRFPKLRPARLGQLSDYPQGGLGIELIAVAQPFNTLLLGAMDTAEDGVAMLHSMADDAAVAMRADWRERISAPHCPCLMLHVN
jgi:hypothetical protein